MALLLSLICIYLLSGCCASILYHRVLAHGAIRLKPWFEKMLVVIALPAGTPIQWAGTHRQHHLYTDRPEDPHSPIIYGFWYAHCGWYISCKNKFVCILYAALGSYRMFFDAYWRPRHRLEYNNLAADIAAQSFYEKISRPAVYTAVLFFYGLLLHFCYFFIWGWQGLFLLWLVFLIIYNLGDSVNSFGHVQQPGGNAGPINNSRINLFIMGEGYHKNHHLKPHLINPSGKRFSGSKIMLELWLKLGLARTLTH